MEPPPLLDPLQVLVMVILFIDGISFRYTTFTFKYRKTNFLTNLKSKIKTKIIKIKRKHLLSRRPCVKTEYR